MAILDTLIFSAYPSGCLCTFALPLLNLPVWSIFTRSLYLYSALYNTDRFKAALLHLII